MSSSYVRPNPELSVNLKSFTDDPKQVNHLVKWWISQKKIRYHRVRNRGTVDDFIQDIWVRLLKAFKGDKEVQFNLSTVVVKNCIWELTRYEYANERILPLIRMAEPIKPHHLVDYKEAELQLDPAFCHERNMAIAKVLRSLTWRQAVIIRARYGLLGDPVMTLDEVAKVLKVTRERVRQIEHSAFQSIQRNPYRLKNLFPFLEETVNTEEYYAKLCSLTSG